MVQLFRLSGIHALFFYPHLFLHRNFSSLSAFYCHASGQNRPFFLSPQSLTLSSMLIFYKWPTHDTKRFLSRIALAVLLPCSAAPWHCCRSSGQSLNVVAVLPAVFSSAGNVARMFSVSRVMVVCCFCDMLLFPKNRHTPNK